MKSLITSLFFIFFCTGVINEKITTHAGRFNATKITYNMKTANGREIQTYKCKEWYAIGVGIIRTEIYHENGQLLTCSELTELKNKTTIDPFSPKRKGFTIFAK